MIEMLNNWDCLNANVLDFLLEHPHLIPNGWKKKNVCFWGTIYKDINPLPSVRYLYWKCEQWHWTHSWLHRSFNTSFSAAVLKK